MRITPAGMQKNGPKIIQDGWAKDAPLSDRSSHQRGSGERSKVIVVNALSALWGGGQTYLFNLFAHLPEDPSLRIIVIAPPGLDKKFAQSGADIFTPRFAGRSVIHRTVWEAWSLPRLLRSLSADVLYCPGGLLSGPSGAGWKTVVAFRNMLPFDKRWSIRRFCARTMSPTVITGKPRA